MPGIHAVLFQQHFPSITEEEAIAAFRSGIAVSVSGYKVSPGFVVRFATEKRPLPPVVMSDFVAESLRALLNHAPTDGSLPPTEESA